MTKETDPHRLEERMLAQASEILEHLEHTDITHPRLPFKERIAAMIMCNTIRKDTQKGKTDDSAGTKVRKYTNAFADASNGRSGDTRSTDADDDDATADYASSESASRVDDTQRLEAGPDRSSERRNNGGRG